MPRTNEENQRIREEQKNRILNGARKAFAQKGPSATISDIAAASGVSQGLAYRYFKSKDEIFKALVEQATQVGFPVYQEILEMPGTPIERLESMIFRLLENRKQRVEFYQLSVKVINDQDIPNNIRKLLLNEFETLRKVMKQLIIEGQKLGEVIEGDPEQFTMIISSCLDGLTRLAFHNPDQFKNNFPDVKIILRMIKS